MDTPIHPAARVETELDALLLHIEVIALTCARDLDSKDAAGDIAYDLVLDCLVRIRPGSWDVAPDDVPRLVRRMMPSRAAILIVGAYAGMSETEAYAQVLERRKLGLDRSMFVGSRKRGLSSGQSCRYSLGATNGAEQIRGRLPRA